MGFFCLLPPTAGVLFATATGKYWILNGQHAYTVSQEVREEAAGKGQQPPGWTTSFRCLIIKDDTPLPEVRRIAGRQQARSQGVQAISFSQTCEMFLIQLKVCLPSSLSVTCLCLVM